MNLNNLGLAKAARALITGEDKVVEKIQQGKAYLVILASDTGQSTSKKIKDKTSFYKVPLIVECSSAELSNAIGGTNIHVIAVMNRGFAKLLEK
ncbi:MAG: ribosomal L7Ae/L30e/S12e/Gadd45 family protein [Acholeplasmatales bacterium]|jgi:ribosomal protein L7Ae-like RNA K-turn-binding protein|nr:ribosomal L7Ae/L30e/S12e/Gadd45 family protein [Acholeplasmatales bacterium]